MILRPRQAAANIDVLRHLQKERGAFDLGELRAKSPNDLVGRNVALVARLQGDEEAAIVLGLRAVGAETHADGSDGGILEDDVGEDALPTDRLLERDVLRCLRGADDEARILLREKALRDDHEEITGRHEGGGEHGKGRPVMLQRDIEALAVAGEEKIETPL